MEGANRIMRFLASRNQVDKYYNAQASVQVLGTLMNNPKLLNRSEYQLDIEDFIGKKHCCLFSCIVNLQNQGLEIIKVADIENYLSKNDLAGHNLFFEKENDIEWINDVFNESNVNNFDYYYSLVRKLSLLRNYLKQGINVTDLLDVDELDNNLLKIQQEKFDLMTIEDIKRYYDKKILSIKSKFCTREEGKSRKSGENAKELRERLRENPAFGLNLESEFLNTITRGALPKKFFLETRDSGCGKSRNAIKRLVNICSPYVWDYKKNKYIINPNQQGNTGLYIGTEMDLEDEIEPMIWAFISGIEQDKILTNNLTKEEEERLDLAMQYSDEMQLFLEDEDNYDLVYLWNTIEKYKNDYNICAVAVDYLELTTALSGEYIQMTRGMTAREDQVLLNLSKEIKSMCKNFDLTIFGYTQTTDEARTMGYRDQRAVKGARSLPNKVDVGITVFEPTNKELELLESVIRKYQRGFNNKIIPNTCYTIYKNRGGRYKDIKIWGVNDLGTGRFIDMFVTDKYYNPIEIEKTIIKMKE
jgi:replicative DNA helicase